MKQETMGFKQYMLLLVFFLGSSLAGASSPALTPEVQTADWAQSWWMPRHEEKLAFVKQYGKQVKLLFIGDSITHSWEKAGRLVWDEYYGKRYAFNLGFSGDRTEQVLWRLQHGEIDGLSPQVVVLMIGTNNTGHRQDPAADTAAGVTAILDELKTRLPETKILLLAVFPRASSDENPLRRLNAEINKKLAPLADNQRVFFLDINHIFLEKDGRLPRNVMPDLLHPNAMGYQLWAQAMEPTLRQLLGEKPEPPAPKVIPLWPDTIPGETCTAAESVTNKGNVQRLTNVSVPTLSLFPQSNSKKPKPAVLVLPGGGYNILAFDKEGIEIAAWLNRIGYTAAVLKYRVPKNRDGALQDAQRAMGLLRQYAGEWGIDPQRTGVLGFSAGGHLAARLSTLYAERRYVSVDDADQHSCRPDFTVLVYPAYLGAEDGSLIADIPVTAQTPPAFIVQTQDDFSYVSSSTAYYGALSKVRVPAELHIFPTGGHGYGLRPSPYPVAQWPDQCVVWLSRLK
ncbi:GDSL-type esterase/lipase family protein [Planctomycetota bacterium]